nr:helicase [Tanacetum cinerariifolium]
MGFLLKTATSVVSRQDAANFYESSSIILTMGFLLKTATSVVSRQDAANFYESSSIILTMGFLLKTATSVVSRQDAANFYESSSIILTMGFLLKTATSVVSGQDANEVENYTDAFIDKETSEDVDQQIVGNLIQILDHYSSVAKAFRMARDWCNTHNLVKFHLRLHSERKTIRQYNTPIVFDVAALIINDFGDGLPTRDVIVNSKDTGPKRISELHPSYMELQYPLLFPYG